MTYNHGMSDVCTLFNPRAPPKTASNKKLPRTYLGKISDRRSLCRLGGLESIHERLNLLVYLHAHARWELHKIPLSNGGCRRRNDVLYSRRGQQEDKQLTVL